MDKISHENEELQKFFQMSALESCHKR